MANTWINRLVVQGPAKDVRAFATAATDPRILKAQGRQPWEGSRRLGLSFLKLARKVPESRASKPPREPVDPWELCVDPEVRFTPGTARRVYKFELGHYTPDDLLMEVSKQCAQLCFVFGWADPNADEQASRFIHRGQSWLYRLSARRKRALQADVRLEGDDDEILWSLIEADWKMMDAVVEHWDRKVATTLQQIARSAPGRGATTKSHRSWRAT